MTWRVRFHEPDSLKADLKNGQPVILAHWHGDEIALLQCFRRYQVATITSTSQDGNMIDFIVRHFGGKTSRGSSTRGGVQALRGLLRLVKENNNCSFAVDGPKGPIYQVKPGVFELSRLLNCPIYTAGVVCDSVFRFPKSWNKTYLPKPFARIEIIWTGPWGPIAKSEDPRSPALAHFLAQKLHESKQSQ